MSDPPRPTRPSLDPDAIIVAGVGARTSIGGDAPRSAAAVRAGINRFGEHPYLIDRGGDPMVIARPLEGLDARSDARLASLTRAAASDALAALRGRPCPSAAVALPEPRPTLEQNLPDAVRAALGALTPPKPAELFPRGHAAAFEALSHASARLRQGADELFLVGACESYLDAVTLEWLDANEQLKSQTNRWGFVPGEAAAFCLLTRRATASRLGLPTLASLDAVTLAQEECRIKTDTVCVGLGLSRALRGALAALPADAHVDAVYCDMNGERYRADEYGFTLTRVGKRLRRPAEFCAPADCWGDVGAASGVLSLCLAVASARRGYAPGPRALLWASSECGLRGAALLTLPIAHCAREN